MIMSSADVNLREFDISYNAKRLLRVSDTHPQFKLMNILTNSRKITNKSKTIKCCMEGYLDVVNYVLYLI